MFAMILAQENIRITRLAFHTRPRPQTRQSLLTDPPQRGVNKQTLPPGVPGALAENTHKTNQKYIKSTPHAYAHERGKVCLLTPPQRGVNKQTLPPGVPGARAENTHKTYKRYIKSTPHAHAHKRGKVCLVVWRRIHIKPLKCTPKTEQSSIQ